MERTGRPDYNCVPVSVERLDQDQDADENVDADQVRTGRHVGSEQSLDLFTQRQEIDIDFRVSGLPHAVVKQAENFRVRELVKKIESHPHRRALQADLQQSNAYNPFSDDSKAMIREVGNVELCSSYAKQFQKCNAQNAFTIGIKEWSIALVDISWQQVTPVDIFTHGDWMFSQSRTMSLRGSDFMVQGTVKLKHRSSFFIAHNARKRCIKKNFKGIHDRFQKDLRDRESQLKVGRTEEKCIEMNELAHKDLPVAHQLRSLRDVRKTGILRWTHLAEMHRWNSDQTSEEHLQICTVFTVSLEKSDLHQFWSTSIRIDIRRLLHPVHHGGSWNDHWWSS